MSIGRASRNTILAGGLVITAIIAGLIVVIQLAGLRDFLGRTDYVVQFSIQDGVKGLQRGAQVLMGGRRVGSVRTIRFEPVEGTPERIDVVIAVDKRLNFRQGAVAYLETPLLGSSAIINFPALGDGPVLEPGSPIPGQLKSLIKQVEDTATRINREFLPKAQEILDDVHARRQQWFNDVDAMLANARAFTEGLNADYPVVSDKIKSGVDEVRALIGNAQEILAENRENVRAGVEGFRNAGVELDEITSRIKDKSVQLVEDLLTDARTRINNAADALDNALAQGNSMLAEGAPQVRRSLANFRLASDQLNATMAEVRQAPWRLLYRPDTREVEFELLYDSARQYAAAVGDLRAASEALQAVLDGHAASVSGAPTDGARSVNDLVAELDHAFERYREAEKGFLDLMIEKRQE